MLLLELFDDLDETDSRIRLRRGGIPNAAGSYGSLVAVMRPEDFIRLTVPDTAGYERIFADPYTDLDTFNRGEGDFSFNRYEIPWLWVSWPDGRVLGHEGRHRAAMVARAGGERFPVVLFFRKPYQHTVTWTQMDREGEADDQDMARSFSTYEEAEAFADDLKRLDRDPDHSHWYSRVNIDTQGGYGYKGHPERSETWDYAAWKPADMPPVLIGQFDPSVRVPTDTMKVGTVKSRHYTR